MRWARAFTGHLADHHQFLFAHTLGRIAGIDADITRHRRADRGASGPFQVDDDPGHQGPHRRRPGRSADTPGLAQVECYTRRSAASRTRRGGEVRQPTCRRWLLCFIPIPSVTSTDSPRSCSVHRPDPPESHWPCRWTSTAPAITTYCTRTFRAWTPIR